MAGQSAGKGSRKKSGAEIVLSGLPASPGLVKGRATVISYGLPNIPIRKLSPDEVDDELERFEQALAITREQSVRIKDTLKQKLKDKTPQIFDAHLLMIDDPSVIEQTVNLIREKLICAEQAYSITVDTIVRAVDSDSNDSYLRERISDIRDVERRVMANLMGLGDASRISLNEPSILVAHDLTPSQTAQLDKKMILGCATDVGGTTSHTAILSRSLEIPAVLGLGNITDQVRSGDEVIVDGYSGRVIIRPKTREVEQFEHRARDYRKIEDRLARLRELPARTLDGTQVELSANIEFPEEVDSVISHGAKGVGLFRTEFLYLTRKDLPDEEVQYEAYARVAERLSPDPVIIRTLDAGADKFSAELQKTPDPNPFLGNRAIRICLQRKDIFRTQLRALLRATVHGNIRILLPFISTVEELKKAIAFIRRVRRELEAEGASLGGYVQVGSMIEVPSAALMAEEFLRFVDFISIGTNDLIQYMLAVDRGNERVAHLYDPFNPAIIRTLDHVISSARRCGKWVGVCGEMAGNPYSALLLVGLGVDELSASPSAIPGIKQLIRSITHSQAREVAHKVLSFNSASRIKNYLSDEIGHIDKSLIELYNE